MDKLKMQSPNLVDANIDKIATLFPNCITEDLDNNGIMSRVVDPFHFSKLFHDRCFFLPIILICALFQE